MENKSAKGEQHTVRNKLKEDLQVMWHKVRLVQMCEREKLPKLKTNSKFIKFQEEINGVIDELLEDEEMDITDINNLIDATATIITQALNEPSKKKHYLKKCKILENKNAETDKHLEKRIINIS